MARSDLQDAGVSPSLLCKVKRRRAYKTTIWFEMAKKASLCTQHMIQWQGSSCVAEYLGKRIQAPQARTSKAILETDTEKILITLTGTQEEFTYDLRD